MLPDAKPPDGILTLKCLACSNLVRLPRDQVISGPGPGSSGRDRRI
jgi:hypothetical protein